MLSFWACHDVDASAKDLPIQMWVSPYADRYFFISGSYERQLVG